MEELDPRRRINVAIAFDGLCAQKRQDSISIQDICDAAGLSRSTFYRSFTSKHDICVWYQDLLLEASFGQVGRTLDWRGAFAAFHSGWLLFPSMNAATKECAGATSVEAHWPLRVSELLISTLSENGVDVSRSLLFQVHFFASTTRPQARTQHNPWTDDIYDCTPDEYGRIMEACVPRDLHRLLNTPRHPNPSPLLTLSKLMARSAEK